MAKFSRYDSRNKKKNRNKNLSLQKDKRIKSVENQEKWNVVVKKYELESVARKG